MKAAAAGPVLLLEGREAHKTIPKVRVSRVLSILDFILRVVAALGTLAGKHFPLSHGLFDSGLITRIFPHLCTWFFVIVNCMYLIVCIYLVLSLPLSIVQIIWTGAVKTRVTLVIFDTVMVGLLTAGASAATAIVSLAHNGNSSANWFPLCRQFNSFCEHISGSLIGSFVAVVVIILLIILSAVAISRLLADHVCYKKLIHGDEVMSSFHVCE